MTDLIPGKRYAVTLHGTADANGDLWFDDKGHHLLWGPFLKYAASVEQLPDPMPQWQVGDVIAWDERVGKVPVTAWGEAPSDHLTVRHVAVRVYTHSGKPYWRDAACRRWSAPTPAVPDEYIADLWNEGRLELVARDGRPWPKDGAR